MDETKCLKVFSKTKNIPATNDLSASCLSFEIFFPGTFEFFPEVRAALKLAYWSHQFSEVPGSTPEVPGFQK
jgi:hypothetical protein